MNKEQLKEYLDPYFELFEGIDCWIAGGCIRDFFINNEPEDVDFWFKNKDDLKKAFDICDSNFEFEKTLARGKKFSVKHLEPSSIDLVCWDEAKDPMPFVGKTPEETISHFQYTIEMAAMDNEGNFYSHPTFHECCENKQLIRNSISVQWCRPNNQRLLKYLNEGYTIDMDNLKVFLDDQEKTFLYRKETGRQSNLGVK